MSRKKSAVSTPERRGKRICVVGGGRWGKNHIRTLNELGLLAGICDTSVDARKVFAKEFPGVELFETIDDALAKSFDGFVVATPAHTHYAVARRVIERGHHVLVEKPITLQVDEAIELCRYAREMSVNLMVGHVLLFHPAIRKMRELIAGGKVGRLQHLYSNRLNLGTVRTEENILWSFAPHDISIFHYLIGTQPISVESRGGVFLQPGIHDTTLTLLRYPDNVVAHVFLSWLHPYKEHRIVVVGTKGMLSFDDSSDEKQLLFYEKGIDWVRGEPIKRDGPTEIIPYEKSAPLAEELRYFAEHLDGRPLEIATGDSGVEVLRVLSRATADLLGSEKSEVKPPPPPPPAEKPTTPYFVHSSAIVDDPCEIGEGTKIWHFSHVQANCKIGKSTSLGQNVNVGPGAVIGDHVKIQNNVSVYEGVTLEDHVFCGPSMVFTNVREPRSKYPTKSSGFHKTLVREGATLGANCTIVCGITVGCHAFVAAGAVVTKDVPDYALMAGVPARRIGWVCECGHRVQPLAGKVRCPRCSIEYRLVGERLTR